MVLTKKIIQDNAKMFYILSEKKLLFSGRGLDPPPLIGDMSPKKSSFFYALPNVNSVEKYSTYIKGLSHFNSGISRWWKSYITQPPTDVFSKRDKTLDDIHGRVWNINVILLKQTREKI